MYLLITMFLGLLNKGSYCEYNAFLLSSELESMKIYIYSENNILIDDDFNSGALISYNSTISSDSLIIFPTRFFSDKGVIDLSRLIVNGSYGSSYNITLTISPKTEGYLPNIVIHLTVKIPYCLRGEYTSLDHHCFPCPANKFLFEPAPFCNDCPNNFKCFGGTKLAPKAGYWRLRNDSLFLISCQTSMSCLEGDPDNPIGICDKSEGYTGIACAQCLPDFMSISGQCIQCPYKKISYLIILSLIGIITLGLNILLIHDSLANECNDENDGNILITHNMTSKFATFVKILLNHELVFFSIGQFSIDWSENIGSSFSIINYGLAPIQAIYSIECYSQSMALSQNLFYFKELVLLLFPLVYSILIILIWIIISIRKTSWTKLPLINYIITSIFIITMQLHANISKIGFLGLNFMNIDTDEVRVYGDLRISPKDTSYLIYGLPLALLIVLIWGLGMLAYFFLILFLNKNKIFKKDVTIKSRYGFLINGYKITAFYWELIVQIRKFLIAAISSILLGFSTTFQILSVICVLIAYAIAYKFTLPFATRDLNITEEVSIATCISQYFIIFIIICYNNNSKITETQGWVILASTILFSAVFIFVFGTFLRREIIKTILNSKSHDHVLIKILACVCCIQLNEKGKNETQKLNNSAEFNKRSERGTKEKQSEINYSENLCNSPVALRGLK